MIINREVRWNLDDILRADQFDELYQQLEGRLGEVDEWITRLNPEMSTDEFRKLVDFEEEIGLQLTKLGYMPSLRESVDQKDPLAKLLKSRSENLGLKFSQKLRRISHWMKGKQVEDLKVLDDWNAKRLFESIPDLTYVLNYSRAAAKYTLNHNEEDIITNKDINGIGPLNDLRDLIETEFEYRFKPKGQKARLIKTQSELMSYTHSPIEKEREAAYKAMLSKHKENLDKFFLIYQAVVKDWDYEARLRGYKSPISVRNFANHVPDEAIEVLLKTCTKNRGVFQNYFQYKADRLGVTKLKRWDIYAPLESAQKEFDFESSKKLVLETFGQFSNRFALEAEKIFSEQHVDSHPRPVKRSGAFCATVHPTITPYVMLNHTNKMRDVFTMAHELGHGVHSLYANQHLSAAQHANLPLAETASTLGEMILFERMYEEEKDVNIKRSMLADKMADTYASILRQNYFVLFEIRAHEAISQKGVTAEELSKMWLETLREQYGESVEVDEIFKYEWAYIPHIVNSPFYCYAYNFGELLSYALYAEYKKDKKEVKGKIERVLESGGSRDPQEILGEVGINMKDEKFWQGSFDIIANWQKELENLN